MDPDHQECHLEVPESCTFDLAILKGIKKALGNMLKDWMKIHLGFKTE